MFLLTVDAYSKWINAQIVGNSTSYMIIEHLTTLFATHSIPEVVVTDIGIPSLVLSFQISPGRMVFAMSEYLLTIPHLMGWQKGL